MLNVCTHGYRTSREGAGNKEVGLQEEGVRVPGKGGHMCMHSRQRQFVQLHVFMYACTFQDREGFV